MRRLTTSHGNDAFHLPEVSQEVPMADRRSECLLVLEAKPERRLQPAEPAAAAERSFCTQTRSAPRDDEEQSGSKWKAMRRERGAAAINKQG